MTRHSERRTSRSKIAAFFISLLLLVIIVILILSSLKGCTKENSAVYAGIGGCVRDPGVYSIIEGTTLFELIRKADGTRINADLSKLNLDMTIKPWEVYCIPCKKITPKKKAPYTPDPVTIDKPVIPRLPEIEQINIIYAGLPRTFILITIYPEHNLILAGHIPWFTAIPNPIDGTKTLYEMYLFGGPSVLAKSVEVITGKKVNYYFTQDRPSWIKFIDHLGGVKVSIPESFAKQYRVNPGDHLIDGHTAWLYITFISKDMRKIDFNTGSHNRIKRQKDFMVELYKRFNSIDFFTSSKLGRQILTEAETNITLQQALPLAVRIKKMKHRKIEFYTLPGMYKIIDGENYWETNLNNYKLRVEELRGMKK